MAWHLPTELRQKLHFHFYATNLQYTTNTNSFFSSNQQPGEMDKREWLQVPKYGKDKLFSLLTAYDITTINKMVHCGLLLQYILHDGYLRCASSFIPFLGRKGSSGMLSFGFSTFLALAWCQIYQGILNILTAGEEGLWDLEWDLSGID